MSNFGLLGEKLGHSYSPVIHSMLADYNYDLYPVEKDKLDDFLKNENFSGLNVTIPYKKEVARRCNELSERAKALGSVNTLLKRADGSLYGHNTDYYGFEYMLEKTAGDVKGKKALVLGSGGASVTVAAVLKSKGAEVVVISRSGENNYTNLHLHKDAKIIVNTTPLGMYPENGNAAVDLEMFDQLEAVMDAIYNPARTALILQAEKLGIKCAGGLSMLVAQAKEAAELFSGKQIPDSEIERIVKELTIKLQNIVIIGMPGCGKTSISKLLGEMTGRTVMDADAQVVENTGKSIPDIFAEQGEPGFRKEETKALAQLGKMSGIILATGGGCITRPENYDLLHQNGIIVWVKRDTALLPTEGRPLSQTQNLNKMYEVRRPLYEAFADIVVDNDGTLEDCAKAILSAIEKL